MPIEAAVVSNSKARLIPWNVLNLSRLVLVGLLFALTLWETTDGLFNMKPIASSNFYVPLLKVVTFVSKIEFMLLNLII